MSGISDPRRNVLDMNSGESKIPDFEPHRPGQELESPKKKKKTIQCCGNTLEYRQQCPKCLKYHYPLPDLKDPIEVLLLGSVVSLLIFLLLGQILLSMLSRLSGPH